MKELTEMIAQALVDKPELVNVKTVDSGFTTILHLSAGTGETGKIIGKKGRTADAMRTILNAVASKEKRRVVLEIGDDYARTRQPYQSLDPMPLAHQR